jgi:cation:H+ antiporter
MNLNAILIILGGFTALTLGAELLVRGASKIAQAAGVSSLVIGLTIVAFGTSAPEMAVSLNAGLEGNSNIAIANVVGSNIFNELFILGVCAIMSPLIVNSILIRFDVPVMIASSFLIYFFSLNGIISALEGGILFFLIIAYTVFIVKKSRSELRELRAKNDPEREKIQRKDIFIGLAQTIFGLGFLVAGAEWLVNGAVTLAKMVGVSDTVIGLTIVAAGTSLPELATSFVATYKGERDIAIGNIIGSNIFNILSILGLSSIVATGGLKVSYELLALDYPMMIGVAVITLPVFFTGRIISRWEGVLFLISYILYATYLVLKSTSHSMLPVFEIGLLYVALPVFIISSIIMGRAAYYQIRKV